MIATFQASTLSVSGSRCTDCEIKSVAIGKSSDGVREKVLLMTESRIDTAKDEEGCACSAADHASHFLGVLDVKAILRIDHWIQELLGLAFTEMNNPSAELRRFVEPIYSRIQERSRLNVCQTRDVQRAPREGGY